MINWVRTAVSMAIVRLCPRVTLFIRSAARARYNNGPGYCRDYETWRMWYVAQLDIDRRSGV